MLIFGKKLVLSMDSLWARQTWHVRERINARKGISLLKTWFRSTMNEWRRRPQDRNLVDASSYLRLLVFSFFIFSARLVSILRHLEFIFSSICLSDFVNNEVQIYAYDMLNNKNWFRRSDFNRYFMIDRTLPCCRECVWGDDVILYQHLGGSSAGQYTCKFSRDDVHVSMIC